MVYIDVYQPPYFQPDVVIEQHQYISPPSISVEPPYSTVQTKRNTQPSAIINKQQDQIYTNINELEFRR